MENRVFRFIRKLYWKKLLLFGFLLLIFLANGLHEEYPDEYDSILGGRYITQGKIPYKDWFQHHQPGAYALAALILPFSGQSFVRFRILLSALFYIINLGGYLLIKNRLKNKNFPFYILFLFITAISATYFWGQMLLADTLSAYLVIPAYGLLLLKSIEKRKFTQKDLILFSIFAFLVWFTSMTYTFLLAGLYLYAFYLFISTNIKYPISNIQFRKLTKAIAIIIAPFVLFFFFLLITGSIKDWFFANITYNQKYYIYNYPKQPGQAINPIRYAIIIAYNFFNNFFPLLGSFKDLNFSDPFRITLAVSNAGFFVYLLLKRKFKFLFPFLIVLVYANARSNPFEVRETDYQASVYILSSIFVGLLSLAKLKEYLDSQAKIFSKKLIASFVFLLLGVFWFFNSFFLGLKFFQKYHAKYMGKAPLIYDRPEIAQLVNKIVKKNEYAWIGPFEFKELFYLNSKVPSKYHWFLDHIKSDEKMKSEMLADFKKNRPKVIVFKRNYAPWGGDASEFNKFFTEYLDKNYFRLFELNQKSENIKYKWKIANTRNFDIDGTFYFDKRRKDEIIKELLRQNLIEKV